MPILVGQVKKAICMGIFKVLYHRNLVWADIKDEDISTMFTSVMNPTGFPNFFAEAVGTAIQQELVIRGSYCDDLEDTLIEYEADDKTWEDLETFIKQNVRNCQASF